MQSFGIEVNIAVHITEQTQTTIVMADLDTDSSDKIAKKEL